MGKGVSNVLFCALLWFTVIKQSYQCFMPSRSEYKPPTEKPNEAEVNDEMVTTVTIEVGMQNNFENKASGQIVDDHRAEESSKDVDFKVGSNKSQRMEGLYDARNESGNLETIDIGRNQVKLLLTGHSGDGHHRESRREAEIKREDGSNQDRHREVSRDHELLLEEATELANRTHRAYDGAKNQTNNRNSKPNQGKRPGVYMH